MSTQPFSIPESASGTRNNAALALDKCGICGNKNMLELDNMEIAMILSLAHMTGWSAELIANKMHKLLGTDISPELVWKIYKEWKDARDEDRLDGSTWVKEIKSSRAMVDTLAINGIEPNYFAKALSQTPSPISVSFAGLWYPKKHGYALLEEFTETTRQGCVKALCWRADEVDLAKPTRDEFAVLEKLGQHVISIAKQLLRRWIIEMAQRQRNMPFTRAIEVCPINTQIVVKYGERFEHEWEKVFGKMDATNVSWLPLSAETQVYHNLSTGHVSKTFFTLMLYTRLETMQERRRIWRNIVGFQPVSLKKIPEDVKDCYICQQPLGVPDENGLVEVPVQLIACCGNYFGSKCLQRWYCEFENAKCPLCNSRASPQFKDRLLYDLAQEVDEVDRDLDNESSKAHKGSVRSTTPGIDNELDQRQRDNGSHIVAEDET